MVIGSATKPDKHAGHTRTGRDKAGQRRCPPTGQTGHIPLGMSGVSGGSVRCPGVTSDEKNSLDEAFRPLVLQPARYLNPIVAKGRGCFRLDPGRNLARALRDRMAAGKGKISANGYVFVDPVKKRRRHHRFQL
jgi:hypothetical protein